MAGGRLWTDEDIKKLKELYIDDNLELDEIAKTLNRTIASIKAQARILGLKRSEREYTKLKVFTPEEERYIIEHYKTESIWRMSKTLHIPWLTIKHGLERLSLEGKAKVIINNDNKWTAEDVIKLRELAKTCTINEIAERLDRSREAIFLKLRRLNIKAYIPNRKWTIEEIDYLRRSWGYVQVYTIANNLHRSVTAIISKAHEMKLGRLDSLSEDIALSTFCANTGIGRDRIKTTLVMKYSFPLKSKKYGKKQYHYFVDFDTILDWLEHHQNLYDGSKIKEGFFVPEPKWLKDKRKKDTKSKENINYQVTKRKWTAEELDYAKSLIELGLSYEEIANRLHRSQNALAVKLNSIGTSYRIAKYWRGKDFKYIKEHWETQSDKEMAKHLGRTLKSVQNQRRSLGLSRNNSVKQSEIDYVKENWLVETDELMAKYLSRSIQTIVKIRRSLDLQRCSIWTEDDNKYIKDNWETKTDKEIAEHLKRTEIAVSMQRNKLGLHRK